MSFTFPLTCTPEKAEATLDTEGKEMLKINCSLLQDLPAGHKKKAKMTTCCHSCGIFLSILFSPPWGLSSDINNLPSLTPRSLR